MEPSATSGKRKVRAPEPVPEEDKAKRSRSSSRGAGAESPCPIDGYIVCPEPNCNKKYKHVNGLRYHSTHAHRKSSVTDDVADEEEVEEEEDLKSESKDKPDKVDHVKLKEKLRIKEQQDSNSLFDNTPNQNSDCVESVKNELEDVPGSLCDSNPSTLITSEAIKTEPQVVQTKTITSAGISSKEKSVDKLAISVSPLSNCSTPSSVVNPASVQMTCSSSTIVPSCVANSENSVCTSSSNNLSLPQQSVMTTLRSPVTSQVYQITPTGCLGGVPFLPQTSLTSGLVSATTMLLSTTSQQQHTLVSNATTATSLSDADRQLASSKANKTPEMSTMAAHGHMGPLMCVTGLDNSSLKPVQMKPTEIGSFTPVRAPRDKDTPSSNSMCVNSQNRKSNDSLFIDKPKNENISVRLNPEATPSKSIANASCDELVQTGSPFQNSEHSTNKRFAIPPSTLSVAQPPKSPITDDVHSPAYSDISDVNDSCSPDNRDSPTKKDESIKNNSQIGPDGNPIPYGNVYFFGGTPNYISHGLTTQRINSPSLSKGISKSDVGKDSRPSSRGEESRDQKDYGNQSKSGSQQDEDHKQKSLINYYAHLHGISPASVQMQYGVPGYSHASVDPFAAQVLAQQDPMYRQQLVEQQKRLLHQQQSQEKGAKSEINPVKQISSGVIPNRGMATGLSIQTADNSGGQDSVSGSAEVRSRDKQNESHQILKENHELKSQMTGVNPDLPTSYHQLSKEQQTQLHLRRAQQLQMHAYHQKVYESQQRLEKSGKTTDLPAVSRHSDFKPLDIKTEVVHGKDSLKSDTPQSSTKDFKQISIKEEIGINTSSSHDISGKTQPLNQSNTSSQSITSNIPSSSSLPSSALATSQPTSRATAVINTPPMSGTGFPYTPYYPPHPVYRALNHHLIRYPGGPPPDSFIHPSSHLGYRLPGPMDSEGKSNQIENSKSGVVLDVDSPKSKSGLITGASGPRAVASPVHKIQVVHDKGNGSPSPARRSPAPLKSSSGDPSSSGAPPSSETPDKLKDKQRDYSSSPPPQRHVHTHHHTHVVGGFPPLYPPDAFSKLFK